MPESPGNALAHALPGVDRLRSPMPRRITAEPALPKPVRLPPAALPALESMLTAAGKLNRSDAPEGREPLLNAAQAKRLRSALGAAPKPVSSEIVSLASKFRGEGAPVASALLLRAAAARADQLGGGPGTEKALATLRAFAGAIGGLDSATLRDKATVLDLDSRHNDSHFDAQAPWNRQGTAPAPRPDSARHKGRPPQRL